ncbi:helix-turn-helix domain-containing protein [Enterococcus faecalis]|uniref:helix-turn-helix domain-containing protein n=1 Tax=Enterococcus faecalis TaxID=1351 RepID=UPI003CC673A9
MNLHNNTSGGLFVKVAGDKIKQARKLKKITQSELANGICTQATISNIENRNLCDSLDIFSSICLRLDLEVEECIRLFHLEAYNLLQEVPEGLILSNNELTTKLLYYKGITCLLGKKDKAEALFYLYRGAEIDRKVNIYNILSLNALGTLYELEKDMRKAQVYYEKSLQELEQFKLECSLERCRIYYNSAKFYSEMKDYQKSVTLSEKGIQICRDKHSIYLLDYLLYEKAFNKQMLGEDTADDYRQAYYFTQFFGNTEVLQYIEKDMKAFNISY